MGTGGGVLVFLYFWLGHLFNWVGICLQCGTRVVSFSIGGGGGGVGGCQSRY